MDMQNVSNLVIPEGEVRTIHDKNNRLIWGRLAYDTKYTGDTLQNGTPTPDTPIPVQTVTGEQTVAVSDGVISQSYSISLGSIELCKIGGYQDYIYKSGNDWYVHKACKSMTLRIANMNNDESYPGWKNLTSLKADLGVVTPSTGNAGRMDVYCPYYTNIKGYVAKNSQTYSDAYISCNFNNNNAIIYLQNSVYGLTQTQWKTQYPNLNFELYYALATAIDTQITDVTLVGQLNAIHEWLTRYGYNATVTGNLPIIIDRTNL